MFSFPLYERLKPETPEFEKVAAFQAGRGRLSVRHEGFDSTARPLRSEFVTESYFSTLVVGAFGGRVFTAEDDKPSAQPVAVLSHRLWQTAHAGDTSVVGSTFIVEGHPFTSIGVAPPGFFGETLQSDPPDIWLPVQQEPLIEGEGTLLHQPVSAGLRMIGRLRSGASIEGMSARLTGVLEPVLTKTLAALDPNLTITSIRTMEQQVALSFDQERAVASLAGFFGIVALLLAAIGLYDVTAYAVARGPAS